MTDYCTKFVPMTLVGLIRLLHQNVDLLQHCCHKQRYIFMRVCFSVCLRHGHLVSRFVVECLLNRRGIFVYVLVYTSGLA